MPCLGRRAQRDVEQVLSACRFVFAVGFMPLVLALGFSRGAEPGAPPLRLVNLLWQ
ncbi:hypothetical protein R5R35_012455 [Gryllus longicercus]|uniref:Mitochondrial import receptor subunit TOM7 homolog n=1 Tax=Gryllus longicercus TaxID=2509291 RepID=A0AAN9Z5Q2_9ORTH